MVQVVLFCFPNTRAHAHTRTHYEVIAIYPDHLDHPGPSVGYETLVIEDLPGPCLDQSKVSLSCFLRYRNGILKARDHPTHGKVGAMQARARVSRSSRSGGDAASAVDSPS